MKYSQYMFAKLAFLIFLLMSLKNGADEPLFEAATLITYAVMLLSILKLRNTELIYSNKQFQIVFVFIFIFIFIGSIGSFTSDYLEEVMKRIFILILIPFLFSITISRSYDSCIAIFKLFIYFTCFLVITGVTLWIVGTESYINGARVYQISTPLFNLSQPNYGVSMRLASLVGNSNLLGLYCSMSVALFFVVQSSEENTKSLPYILLLILIPGVFLTQSRAAILFLVVVLYVNVVGLDVKRTLFFFLIATLVYFIFDTFAVSNSSYDNRMSAGLNDRDLAWSLIFNEFNENLYFGAGIGSVTEMLKNKHGLSIGAHSLYFTFLFELGVIGFFCFLSFLGSVLYFSLRYKSSIAFLIGIYIHQIVEVQLFKSNAVFLIFLVLIFFNMQRDIMKRNIQ